MSEREFGCYVRFSDTRYQKMFEVAHESDGMKVAALPDIRFTGLQIEGRFNELGITRVLDMLIVEEI